MKKEQYAKLFKALVGRELTPQEFLQAKASGFDPQHMKQVAGLVAAPAVDAQAGEGENQAAEAVVSALPQIADKAAEKVAVDQAGAVRKPVTQKNPDEADTGACRSVTRGCRHLWLC